MEKTIDESKARPDVGCTELLAVPSDAEMRKAAKQFREDRDTAEAAAGFEAGARWARWMSHLRTANAGAQRTAVAGTLTPLVGREWRQA